MHNTAFATIVQIEKWANKQWEGTITWLKINTRDEYGAIMAKYEGGDKAVARIYTLRTQDEE